MVGGSVVVESQIPGTNYQPTKVQTLQNLQEMMKRKYGKMPLTLTASENLKIGLLPKKGNFIFEPLEFSGANICCSFQGGEGKLQNLGPYLVFTISFAT